MAETPNHEYNVPDQGQQDWHVPLNENFEAFEVDIELRDQEGNLGNYTPTEGAKFLATDTGVVYVGDGNDWVPQFVLAAYDPSADEATVTPTLVTSELDVGTITGQLTGGAALTSIAGNNLSIDSNGQLNASTGGGSGGISNLSGGDGIDPDSISDGDTLSVAWGEASSLDGSGAVTDWSGAADLDSSGAVTDWSGAADLNASGAVDAISGSVTGGTTLSDLTGTNLSIDSNGRLNATTSGGGISGLSGGDGIDPDSIGDGDTVSVAWGDASGLDTDGNVTDRLWSKFSSGGTTLLEPADAGVTGVAAGFVTASQMETESSEFTLNSFGERMMEMRAPKDDDSGTRSAGNILLGYETNTIPTSGVYGATISGGGRDGDPNKVEADYGTVGGGKENEALGENSTVSGGENNKADGQNSTVGGGNSNNITGEDSTIGGGNGNDITDDSATIAGGLNNEITSNTGAIGGGANNTIDTQWGTIAGGSSNTASGVRSVIAGGSDNQAKGRYSTVSGGAPTDFNNISGTRNIAADNYCTVGGGGNNRAGSIDGNTTNATFATVSGGEGNRARSGHSTVSGGQNNATSGEASTVPGGQKNTASGNFSFAAGRNATASNDGSFVVGDSSSDPVSSDFDNQAVFQQSITSRRSITTADSYNYADTGLFLGIAEDSNGNDVWQVADFGVNGTFPLLEVNISGDTTVHGDLDVDGEFTASSKNFAETVDTDDGEKEVVYTSSEAGTARTEASGVAELEDGRAEIDLPDHFGWVTSDDEPLVVQTTPYASEPVRPQVTERSTDRVVIEDFSEDADDYEVAYTVKGTRDGYEDKQVVREPEPSAAPAQSPEPADD